MLVKFHFNTINLATYQYKTHRNGNIYQFLFLVFQLLISLSFIASFVDAEQFRNVEVQNFFDNVGRHQAIYDSIEERSETTASSSNRTFDLLTEWLYGKTTEKATESTTTMSISVTNTTSNSEEKSTTTGSVQGES